LPEGRAGGDDGLMNVGRRAIALAILGGGDGQPEQPPEQAGLAQ
jgi:hypothetical protein